VAAKDVGRAAGQLSSSSTLHGIKRLDDRRRQSLAVSGSSSSAASLGQGAARQCKRLTRAHVHAWAGSAAWWLQPAAGWASPSCTVDNQQAAAAAAACRVKV
jgi:hypothetical protein